MEVSRVQTLSCLGYKEALKLKGWGQSIRARVEKMLPSSSTTPAATLVSSETLTTMTLPARSQQNVESKDLDTESESDAEEEVCVSENDWETTVTYCGGGW
jgi:hypothetical protein